MPVYNGELFIREALDSLLAQTFTDFELIISDNCSTDGTEAICREYADKDSRIRYVRQAENRGATANFKFVFDEAVGEYFMWAAADDIWNKDFLHHCTTLLLNRHDVGMAMTGYRAVSRTSRLFNRYFNDPLKCIEIKNSEERTITYTEMPFSTHKDNLVYALWKKDALHSVLQELREVFGEQIPIGSSMNELALLKFRGAYTTKILFDKRYKYVPPGHWINPLVGLVAKMKHIIQKKHTQKSTDMGKEKFLSQLEEVIRHSGVRDSLVDSIIEKNRKHLKI